MLYPIEAITGQYRSLYEAKVGKLAEIASPLLERLGDMGDPVFRGTHDDIETIGVIYYHDLDSLIDTNLLEEGAALVLGYFLVNCHGFDWGMMRTKSDEQILTITHPKLDRPLLLTPENIRSSFPVRDVLEGEESDFSEYMDEAYEALVHSTGGRQRRRKMRWREDT